MHILLVRLSAIGDIIHTLPLAHAIKRRYPQAKLWWLCEPAGGELLQDNPCVDKLIIFKRKDVIKKISNPFSFASGLSDLTSFLQELKAPKFDIAIDAHGLLKSGLCTYFSGAKYRIGFAQAREGSANLLTDKVDVGDYFSHEKHVVFHNLALLSALSKHMPKISSDNSNLDLSDQSENLADSSKNNGTGINSSTSGSCISCEDIFFPLPKPSASIFISIQERLSKFLSLDNNKQWNTILIPGTTWTSKIWPEEKWVELAKTLYKERNCHLILIGSKSEIASNERIEGALKEANIPLVNLTATTSLTDLIYLFRESQLVIGADTGPLHLAAATKRPYVIGIYGSTPVLRNGPFGSKCHSVSLKLDCQPCFQTVCPLGTKACLEDLESKNVYEEIFQFIDTFS